MKHIATAIASVVTALVVTLGVWFAPTHGQPNDDLAQLVDVTVLDEQGNAVPGASISLQRMNGRDAANVRRGGATNAAGERSVEMPVEQGRYRIVMTVPQGYSPDRDDADDLQPGPNAECAGMVRRCVLLDVDATGQVSITTPRRGSDPTAITFHVRRDVVPMLLSVTQKDTGGTPVHGGTFVMRSFEIVEVNGQNVRRYGRPSRTGMTTSARTFRVQPHTSYVISWEPPQGYLRHAPVAPSQYEITTGASGTISKDFVVRRPAALGEQGADLRGSSNGPTDSTGPSSPSVTPSQPAEPGEQPQQQSPAPQPPAPQSPAPSGSTGAIVPEPEQRTGEPVADETVVPEPTVTVSTPEVADGETVVEVEIDQDPAETGIDAELDPELAAELEAERADAAGVDVATRVDADGGFPDLGTSIVDVELDADVAAELEAEIAG